MKQSKLLIGKEQLASALRDLGYKKTDSLEIVSILLEKIGADLLAGKSINLNGTCMLTANFKKAGLKSVAGQTKQIQRSVSISAKTSRALVAAYRADKKPEREVTPVRSVGKLFE